MFSLCSLFLTPLPPSSSRIRYHFSNNNNRQLLFWFPFCFKVILGFMEHPVYAVNGLLCWPVRLYKVRSCFDFCSSFGLLWDRGLPQLLGLSTDLYCKLSCEVASSTGLGCSPVGEIGVIGWVLDLCPLCVETNWVKHVWVWPCQPHRSLPHKNDVVLLINVTFILLVLK